MPSIPQSMPLSFATTQLHAMQTKHSIRMESKSTFNNLQRSMEMIVNYITICCNESINYFGNFFVINQVNQYYYHSINLDPISRDMILSSNIHNIDDMITTSLPVFITKIKEVLYIISIFVLNSFRFLPDYFRISILSFFTLLFN